MICLLCRQSEMNDGLTSVSFQRGEMHLTINNVPARVCPSCGEALVDEQVAVLLLRNGYAASNMGVMQGSIEYNSLT